MFKSKFKKFGGDQIPDIVEYLTNSIVKEPNITISIGCDSIQKRRKTIFAITIMLYNTDIRNGAHVVFFRESCPKIRDTQSRLYREAEYLHLLGTFLHDSLFPTYKRIDLTEIEIKKYKYHLLKCDGEYKHVPPHLEEGVVNSLSILSSDRLDYKLVDIHVDFNPFEGNMNQKGHFRNKSYTAYKSYASWLRGLGFRVWAKPLSYASSTAADLLLHD